MKPCLLSKKFFLDLDHVRIRYAAIDRTNCSTLRLLVKA
jgi:hypothetical protein